MAVHIAYYAPTPVDASGTVINKATASLAEVSAMRGSVPIVKANATYAPNATGSQTLEEYLTVEAAAGFNLLHMGASIIVTSNV